MVSWPIGLRARKLDRMGLLTLIASLYFLQYWGLALNDASVWPHDRNAKMLLIAMSALGILLPRLYGVMLVNALAYVAAYGMAMPVASNNQTTAFFVCLVILAGAAVTLSNPQTRHSGQFRERIFTSIAGPGRYILAGLYFYGIYHKINTDFLNPEVSCAVALYRPLAMPFGLEDWRFAHFGAIYATFVVEFLAMILLFSPRFKRVGMALGIPFHIVIGWTGYAFYKDFSTVVLALYAMFLTAEILDRANLAAARLLGGERRACEIGRLVLIAVFGLYLVLTVGANRSAGLVPTHEGFTWFFSVYALAFLVFAIAFVPMRMSDPLTDLAIRPPVLAIFPILFFLNGASPYLGLKTESSIAMFSNLYTEGNETNHLIHGQLPFAAGYQNDLVVPLESNDAGFDRRFLREGQAMVRYEFDRAIAGYDQLQVVFSHNGGPPRTLDGGWENTYLAASPLLRSYLVFKPVELSRPHPCTH